MGFFDIISFARVESIKSKLIVGLGNAASHYDHTRHNVGFDVVRELGNKHGVIWERELSRGFQHGYVKPPTTGVRLILPLRLMNRSGEALLAATQLWRVGFEDILMVCDDVNLPLGKLRLRPGGSDGGHHGLASCLEALGTREVPRLRIGVGRESLPKDLTEFVLSPFTTDERGVVDEAVKRAMEACEVWAAQGMQVAMNRVNTQTREDPRGESGI